MSDDSTLDDAIAAGARIEAVTGKNFDLATFRWAWMQVHPDDDPLDWDDAKIAENLTAFAETLEGIR